MQEDFKVITLNVKGMHCKSCKMLVNDALEENGATNIRIDLDEKKQLGKVSFENLDKKKAVELIKKEGYDSQ